MRRYSDKIPNRSEQGQSAVELALAFPALLLILMGALDFGRAYFAYISITNAAREGAQYGTWHPTDSTGIANAVTQELANSGVVGATPVAVACLDYSSNSVIGCSTAHIGDKIAVTVSYNFSPMTTSILPFANTIPMSNFATMAIIVGQMPAHPS